MPLMARLAYSNRITVRTSADVVERLNVALSRFQRAGVKFGGRKLGLQGLVGSVLLDFLDRTDADQLATLMARLVELEAQLDAPDASRPDQHGPARVEPTRVIGPEGGRKRKARGA